MKRLIQGARRTLLAFGIDPRKTIHAARGLPSYLHDLRMLKRQQNSAATRIPFGDAYPFLEDRFSPSGFLTEHYFHQDLLVARRIHLNNPLVHVDVGSRLDGFVAHVAAFRQIEVLDIRPMSLAIPNVQFVRADLMAPLRHDLIDCCDSLSCLHALEHFGLGRYGDPVNYDGHLAGLSNLHTILKQGGKLYVSVPIGPLRIEFNAHRVFSMRYLLDCFADYYRIDQFSFVDDHGDLHENAAITDAEVRDSFGCWYGCGIFEMTKR